MNKPIDLTAIRARVESETMPSGLDLRIDLDALLAEVERLQAELTELRHDAGYCSCGDGHECDFKDQERSVK